MSFTDWVHNSRRRMKTKPTHKAIEQSASEFVYGGVQIVKWNALKRLLGGSFATKTNLAGSNVFFDVENWEDLRRAETGLREEEAMEWLFEAVDSNTVFWDIGGFHGTYSVVAADKGADVIVFEPHPDNRTRLLRNVALNDLDVDLNAVALSDKDRIQMFTDPERNAEFAADPDGTTKVRTKRGDDIAPKPDVVKLDVEGHECAALDGMEKTLASVDRILIEVHLGVDEDNVRDRLSDAGLDVTEVMAPRSETYLGGVRR